MSNVNVYKPQGGDSLVIGSGGSLVQVGKVGGADITVGADESNARDVTIQLNDANGDAITSRQAVTVFVFADANGDAFATTGGSTGLAIDTNGALLAVVAKKQFTMISEANGVIGLTWTDTAGETAYLGVQMPDGTLVISDALTTAGE